MAWTFSCVHLLHRLGIWFVFGVNLVVVVWFSLLSMLWSRSEMSLRFIVCKRIGQFLLVNCHNKWKLEYFDSSLSLVATQVNELKCYVLKFPAETRRIDLDSEEAMKRRKQRAKKRKQQMQKQIEENKVRTS